MLQPATTSAPSPPSATSDVAATTVDDEAVKAKFQKGEKKDEYSGAIYFRGKPRYGNNEIFKAKVGDKLLAETLRWNDEFKLYSRALTPGSGRASISRSSSSVARTMRVRGGGSERRARAASSSAGAASSSRAGAAAGATRRKTSA